MGGHGRNDLDRVLCRPCVDVGGDDDVDTDLALLEDPIVGVERVLSDQNGPGAIDAKPLASPPSMSPAAFARHCLTHLPYHPGCPICAATRRPNTQHRKSNEASRIIPLLVGDYGFVRSSLDEKGDLQTVLVLRILPYKLLVASVVPVKGLDQAVAQRVARFIKEAGLVHFAFRSDRELAITSLLEEAIRLSGRRGIPVDTDSPPTQVDPPRPMVEDDEPDAPTCLPWKAAPDGAVVAVPELTHPGESPSNGIAERAVETVVDHTRTIIAALEMRLQAHIPSKHAIMAWAVEHSAYLLNKYLLGNDNRTA